MERDLVILPDGYQKRSALFVLIITVALFLLFWRSGVAGSAALAGGSFIGLFGLLGLLSFETRIARNSRSVIRVWSLAGVVPLWTRVYPGANFRGIQQRIFPDGQHDVWQIGLVTDTGKFVLITDFSSRTLPNPLPEAERFRDYLAGLLRMPVLEGRTSVVSSKFQAPSTREVPNSNSQIHLDGLVILWCLELGIW